MAAVILVIGVTGVLQAVMVSSAQNASAGRITEASTISNQLANGLLRYDVRQLKETSGFFSRCSSAADILSYAGGVDAWTNISAGMTRCSGGNCASSPIATTPCVVDIDAYEADASVVAARKIVPGYDFTARFVSSRGGYKRVAVIFDDSTASKTVQVTTVVSFMDAGRRRFLRRTVNLSQPTSYAGF